MTPTWWALVGPAESEVHCGPNRHRLRWADGRLLALDHPASEAVLDELSDVEQECEALVRRWAEHVADPRVLVLGARHPGDAVTPATDVVERARSDGDPRLDLLTLLALDAPLQRRLQQEVAGNLANDESPSARACLEAATVGRLLPVLRRWGGLRPWEVAIGPPLVDPDRPASVTVGPGWLAEVWGSYLAVVAGHLVLEVLETGKGRARVRAVAAPGRPPRTLTVLGPAPWRPILAPEDEPA